MKVLVVTNYFAGKDLNPWLIDDIAVALSAAGHQVDVIVHDAKNGHTRGESPSGTPKVRVWHVGSTKARAGKIGRVVGHLQAAWGLRTIARRLTRNEKYDLGIYTSIALFSWGFPRWAKRRSVVARLVLVLWDFFPIHQAEIGRIGTFPPLSALKRIERWAIAVADVVALMSPANAEYFRNYHPNLKMPTAIVPPWSSSGSREQPRFGGTRDRFTVVFGGQLARGRGVGDVLEAAALVQDSGDPIDFIIAGSGPEEGLLRSRAGQLGLSNTLFTGELAREDYRDLLRTVHVGLAITVPGVTAPSFPSKIVEYCGLGLPVIVATEAASDAGASIENAGAGVAVPVGDPAALAHAIRRLHGERESGTLIARGRAARMLYEAELSSARAAESIAALAS